MANGSEHVSASGHLIVTTDVTMYPAYPDLTTWAPEDGDFTDIDSRK